MDAAMHFMTSEPMSVDHKIGECSHAPRRAGLLVD
jgi:hypothetical protein